MPEVEVRLIEDLGRGKELLQSSAVVGGGCGGCSSVKEPLLLGDGPIGKLELLRQLIPHHH